MNSIGLDCGSSTIKLVLLSSDKEILRTEERIHYGKIRETAYSLLTDLIEEGDYPGCPVVLTGCACREIQDGCREAAVIEDIPAIVTGTGLLAPNARSVIEIGSQNARYITGLAEDRPPVFAVNEHCAGGTGSFFEDQMSRLGLPLENYSALAAQAKSVPHLSGRCSVFAKTDIIHRQQEGVPAPDILLGLCYAMIRNYRAVIVRGLPVNKPVALCGGIARNGGVVEAVRSVFYLSDEELIIPEHASFAAAVGAAATADNTQTCSVGKLISDLYEERIDNTDRFRRLAPLSTCEDVRMPEPHVSGIIPPKGCALGIDIGSTSTDFVLIDSTGNPVDFLYLRTAGNPERAVREGLKSVRGRFGEFPMLAVGVTGSGRERIGNLIGADLIQDEITAQASSAAYMKQDADTVFEIGGQDSKYISLKSGRVVDFQMNKICAAGTGSFVEEQAARMGVTIEEFGNMAMNADAPVELGERCTVFMETAIRSALALGAKSDDVAAGLCHSIVDNYLNKVVGNKPVGQRIILQGGVAYNPAIVSAFRQRFGDRLTVSPLFPISGAHGVALQALEHMNGRCSAFHGFDTDDSRNQNTLSDDMQRNRNIEMYENAGKLLLAGYDPTTDSRKKTVGIPFALMIHKFFPMANAFFKTLGFNVLLSPPTDEEIIRLSQQSAMAETCYPVKLVHGHMVWLAEHGVDYIFMPSIHTMKHETSQVEHNYGCVYMQTAVKLAAQAAGLEERGIELLNPVFDLNFGQEAMASSMLALGRQLGVPKVLCIPALMAGAKAVRKHTAAVEKQGAELLASLRPEDKVIVLITRNYGISDPVLNMGIPKLLLERGHRVITLSHLPAHDLDISSDHLNLYWPFGQHIISGAKLVAHHPNLYAVYLTNHGCGPDTMLSHLFRQEMGDKPYLQIEVDEHFSPVGVITRIEAFLQSLESRPAQTLSQVFDLKAVSFHATHVQSEPGRKQESEPLSGLKQSCNPGILYVPDIPPYTAYLLRYFATQGINARALPLGGSSLALGRAETNSKEYLPFTAVLGAVLEASAHESEPFQVLLPCTQGAEADGQYAWAAESVLARKNVTNAMLVAPVLETLGEKAADTDLLIRAVCAGDLMLCAPPEMRDDIQSDLIPTWSELEALTDRIGAEPIQGRSLAAVGEPVTLFALDDGVLNTLEQEGYRLHRAPLIEWLCFLWQDANYAETDDIVRRMANFNRRLGAHSSFSSDWNALRNKAEQALPGFAGANGRYRLAKALDWKGRFDGLLTVAPRYENTATVLEMTPELGKTPHFSLLMDGDWDESSWNRLRSFLYYC